MSLTRREFLFLGVGTGAVVAVGVVVPLTLTATDLTENGPDGATPSPPDGSFGVVGVFPKQTVASISALAPGVPVAFDYPGPGQSNYVVKLGREVPTGIGPDGDIVAFSRVCTHMGCVIEEYHSAEHVLGPCPCHFSTFDFAKDGGVVLGQATQNLPQVVLNANGDDVEATGLIRLVYGQQTSAITIASVGASS
jgi:arsenite oxidase small subunit